MKAIDDAVTAKLKAQRGHEDALALWKEISALFEKGGAGAAEDYLDDLLEAPADDDEGSR